MGSYPMKAGRKGCLAALFDIVQAARALGWFALCTGRAPIRETRCEEDRRFLLRDQLVASYPVVVEAIDQPTDDDFIERVKQQMRSYYSGDDIRAAKFLVRSFMD